MSEGTIKEKLQAILNHAVADIEASDALDKLNDVRVNVLGKKGELTAVLKGMKDVAPEDRPKVGQLVNDARVDIETRLEAAKAKLEAELRAGKESECGTSSSEYHRSGRGGAYLRGYGLRSCGRTGSGVRSV